MVYDWMWFMDSSCHHVASIWRVLLQLKFIGWKRVHRIFQTSVWYPTLPLSQSETILFFPIAKYAWNAICWCQVRINCHMVLSQFQPFGHPWADVPDWKILRMLGYIIARNIKSKILFFWKVGGAKVSIDHVRCKTLLGLWLSNWDFFARKIFQFHSQFYLTFLECNQCPYSVPVHEPCENCTLVCFHDHISKPPSMRVDKPQQ